MPFPRYILVAIFQLILTLFIFTSSASADWVCNGAECIGGRSTCDIDYPPPDPYPDCVISQCGGDHPWCVGQCCRWEDPQPPPPPPEPPPPPPAGCFSDSDCIDGNPCTVDFCLGQGSPGSGTLILKFMLP